MSVRLHELEQEFTCIQGHGNRTVQSLLAAVRALRWSGTSVRRTQRAPFHGSPRASAAIGRLECLEDRVLLTADQDMGFFGLDDGILHAAGDLHTDDLPAEFVEQKSGFGSITDGSSPATKAPGPNLQLNSVHLRDGQGNSITAPVIGERVAVQVNYSTADLPSNASYEIYFSVDGVVLSSSTVTAGAGSASGSWYWWRSGWLASPGSHTVQVTLDALGTVSEVNESDNTASFSFSPVQAVIPQKLVWPIEGTPFVTTTVANYVDTNPLSGIGDYHGGALSYNGHDAWDIGPPGFLQQDEGLELYAAADGVVVSAHDGEYDRQTAWLDPAPAANYVIIDHGDGWRTLYWHMREDSVTVNVGDIVQAGDVIGYMGSSGISTGTHVHFTLQHYGFTVEPMFDESTYMASPVGYVGDQRALMQATVTNYNPGPHHQEHPSEVRNFKQQSGTTVYVIGDFSGIQVGDLIEYVWKKPDGTTWLTTSHTSTGNYGSSWWWWSRTLPTVPDLGTWTIDFRINSVSLGTTTFDVTATGAPEIAIQFLDSSIILDERHTPIAFPTVTQGSVAPSMTFNVTNHGTAALNLGTIDVPAGFSVSEGLPASIAPGVTDSFTVVMNTATAGNFAGQIHVANDDSDEGDYVFSVEGIVQTAVASDVLTLGISERQLTEGGRTVANVRRSGSTSLPLTVDLSAVSGASEVSFPASVVIPAGSDRAIFFIDAVQDAIIDGDSNVALSAASAGLLSATADVRVLDRRSVFLDITPVEPLGSLIHEGNELGLIAAAGEVSSYLLSLEAGQTMSVGLEAGPGLVAELEVLDPGGKQVSVQTATAGGEILLMNSLPVTAAGTYEIKVRGQSGSTGLFNLRVLLNSVFEVEQVGGPANDSTSAAESLNPGLINLTGGPEMQTAVAGIAQTATPDVYRIDLQTGDLLTLASVGDVTLSLLSPAAALIARGITAGNVSQLVSSFVAPSAGTYYARIIGATEDAIYQLLATVNANFDQENNSSLDLARDISDSGSILGYVKDVGAVGQFDTPLINRNGQGSNGVVPPDTVGDVGINYYIQAINHPNGSVVTIYNKSDGSVAHGPFLMDTLAASGPGTDGAGDPIVLFDHLAGRWVLAEFSGSANGLSVFVSQTGDPTAGTWNHYFFGTPDFPDYPKLAVWADGYYLSTNEDPGSPVYVLDRENMLLGNTVRPMQRFTAPDLAGFGFQALTPADLDGPAPPADAPAIFMRHRDDEVHNPATANPSQDFLEIWQFHTDFSNPANSTFAKIADIPIAEIDSDLNGLTAFEAFPQPGTATRLDPIREVIMWRLQYRNFGAYETLVGNLTTDVDGTDHGGVRWFELRRTGGISGTWVLHQEGTIAPDEHNRWLGAISMDGSGNIAVAYNAGSSTQSIGIQYTGRLASDPLGTMPQGEHVLVAGIGAQTGSTRWGDYAAMSVDPVDDQTFWFTGEYVDSTSGGWNTRIGAFVLQPPSDTDYVSFEAAIGDPLVVETSTPFHDFGQPDNSLLPEIEFFDPAGNSIAIDSGSAADGLNARIAHTAAVAGTYRVRVSGTGGTEGTYVLRISGNTPVGAGPTVTSTTPLEGEPGAAFPAQYVVDFSEVINVGTLTANDLLVGGFAATSLTQIDGDTFAFTLNPAANVGDGTYTVQIAANAVSDLQGSGNPLFLGTFVLDSSGPIVTGTTFNGNPLVAGISLTPGPLHFTATFDEALKVYFRGRGGLRTPTAADVELINLTTGTVYPAIAVNSNLARTNFSADFPDLPEGHYQLRLISGDGAFEDAIGNDLDGEALGGGDDGTPTGDGTPGGDYVVSFNVDRPAETDVAFSRLAPLGSLILAGGDNTGVLHAATDRDDFGVFLSAGESISAVLTPDAAATMTLEVLPSGQTSASPLPGQSALLNFSAPTAGHYTFRVSADIGAGYRLNVLRNAIAELQFGDSGVGNPVSLQTSHSTAAGEMWSVIGTADVPLTGPLTFVTSNNPASFNDLFIDISGTGIALNLSDDGLANVVTTVGNSGFPAGPVSINNNGGIAVGADVLIDYTNEALPTTSLSTALLPYWTDIDASGGNVYWEERDVNGVPTLIVQWDQRPHYDQVGDATFQLQLPASGPWMARFLYPDVDFGEPLFNGGLSTTIGYQENSASALQYSFNTSSVANNDVIDLVRQPQGTDSDLYQLDLSGHRGQQIDILLSGLNGLNPAAQTLELLDVNGTTVLATGSRQPVQAGTTVTSYGQGILDFEVPQDGVYFLRVTSTDVRGEYTLAVLADTVFDTEPNSAATAPLRSLTLNTAGQGFLDASTDASDLYVISLSVGQTIVVSTSTPLDEAGQQSPNLLDPQLQILGADGVTILAGDQDSLNGRNARISYTATQAGTHFIRIQAQAGQGEYRLNVVPEGGADLVAISFDALSDHVLLGQTDVTYTISNAGIQNAGSFQTHVVWSPNAIVGDSDDVVVAGSADTVAGLNAGASVNRTLSLQLDRVLLFANAIAADAPGLPVNTLSASVSYLFLVLDVTGQVAETDESNNSGQGLHKDSDDVTYFPWDRNGDGVVQPLDALPVIQSIASSDAASDFDGDGVVTPLEALSSIQRIGYVRNASGSSDPPPSAPAAGPEFSTVELPQLSDVRQMMVRMPQIAAPVLADAGPLTTRSDSPPLLLSVAADVEPVLSAVQKAPVQLAVLQSSTSQTAASLFDQSSEDLRRHQEFSLAAVQADADEAALLDADFEDVVDWLTCI
ncbi:MAG: peptidoglycan DD-metalloendopeptidase family protein [Planctomycetaceae bacterium]